VVGDQDPDAHVAKLADDRLDVQNGDRIDSGERLVQQDETGSDRQRAGDLQATPLAAGELIPPGPPHRDEIEVGDQLVHPASLLGAAKTEGLEHGAEVAFDRQSPEHGGLLREIADALLRPEIHGQVGDLGVIEEHPAPVRPRQSDHDVEGRRLAGAVGPKQPDDLSLGDLDRHVLDHGPAPVHLPDVLGADAVAGCGRLRHGSPAPATGLPDGLIS